MSSTPTLNMVSWAAESNSVLLRISKPRKKIHHLKVFHKRKWGPNVRVAQVVGYPRVQMLKALNSSNASKTSGGQVLKHRTLHRDSKSFNSFFLYTVLPNPQWFWDAVCCNNSITPAWVLLELDKKKNQIFSTKHLKSQPKKPSSRGQLWNNSRTHPKHASAEIASGNEAIRETSLNLSLPQIMKLLSIVPPTV